MRYPEFPVIVKSEQPGGVPGKRVGVDKLAMLALFLGTFLLLGGGQEEQEEAPPIAGSFVGEAQDGLNRTFRRLDTVFETPEDYLNFWFPDQNLTYDDLPPDLADYYRYDLERVQGGYRPRALAAAAREDSESVSSESPTLDEMRGVACPVALARAAEGFFPGSAPLISDETRDAMASVLDLREELAIGGATHYTMLLLSEYALQLVRLLDDDGWWRN